MATIDQFKNIMRDAVDKTDKKRVNESGKDIVIDLHINRWLEGKGITAPLVQHVGKPSSKAYSRAYEPVKRGRGRQVQFVDLLFDGDFYKNLKSKATNNGFEVIQGDPDSDKVEDLDRFYLPTEIYGIAENQEDQLAEVLKPGLITELEKTILNAL